MEKDLIKFALRVLDYIKEELKFDSLFVEHTVEEWLWGYNDPLLQLIYDFAKLVDANFANKYIKPNIFFALEVRVKEL